MEKKNYYYLKEIILGLKDEYVKYQKQLQELKQYTQIIDKNTLDDFYFWLFQSSKDEKPELECVIEKKKNRMQCLIEDIQKTRGSFIYGKGRHECYFNNNGQTIINDGKISIYGLSPEFCQQVKAILTSSFANEIFLENIPVIGNDGNPFLSINQSFIRYLYSVDSNSHVSLECRPELQTTKIYIGKYDSIISEEIINTILYSKFSKNSFSKYHQKIIDTNSASTKSIKILEIPTMSPFGFAEPMELVEDEKGLVLKKQNNVK